LEPFWNEPSSFLQRHITKADRVALGRVGQSASADRLAREPWRSGVIVSRAPDLTRDRPWDSMLASHIIGAEAHDRNVVQVGMGELARRAVDLPVKWVTAG